MYKKILQQYSYFLNLLFFLLAISSGHSTAADLTSSIILEQNCQVCARITPPEVVCAGESSQVLLDGSSSSDASGDNNNIGYTWFKVPQGAEDIVLNDQFADKTFFIVPPVDQRTRLTFHLIVYDLDTPSENGSATVNVYIESDTTDTACSTEPNPAPTPEPGFTPEPEPVPEPELTPAPEPVPDPIPDPAINIAPVANAGFDKTVAINETVILDGTASTDADGDSLSYSWSLLEVPGGSNATLSNPATATPGFVVDLAGTYVVGLTVNDGMVSSLTDTVTISTGNSAPVANAGFDQSVSVAETVTLNGSGSSDIDGDSLTYSWSLQAQPSESTAVLFNADTVTPGLIPDIGGTYIVQLIVSDGTINSSPDVVTISTINSKPVADAGPDQSVLVTESVTLNGSDSSDVDGDALTYFWSLTIRPVGSNAVLSDPNAISPVFTADVPGMYTAQLIVSDGTTASVADTVMITTVNSIPVANAGLDQTAVLNQTIILDGSSSIDVDGDSLAYSWSLTTPAGSTASLSNVNSVKPEFTIDSPGTYIAQLIVNDGAAASLPDTVMISVVNSAPIANAGEDQTAFVTDTVTVDGTASTDVDGDLLTYHWSLTTPAGSTAVLSSVNAVMPSFILDKPGDYIAQLIVNDGRVDSTPATVTISTTNSAPLANAGVDQVAAINETITLDGSLSSDVDGDSLTYSWSLTTPPGSTAVLSSTDAVMPVFILDKPGDYIAQLIVNDGTVDSLPDTVINSTENIAPLANAGVNQELPLGSTVTLDGSGSSDADFDPLSYSWSLLTKPAGSTAVLSSTDVVMPTFVMDKAGDYVAQLIVNDGTVNSLADTVVISTENAIPVADAGPDQELALGSIVTLDGSGSGDPDLDTLSYSWSFLTRPADSVSVLSSADAVMPTFVLDKPGDYTVQLIVNDGTASSLADTVLISTENIVPLANAGADQGLAIGTTVTLDGSASSDADQDTLSYNWSLLSKPAASTAVLSSTDTVMPTFVLDKPGEYIAQLIVNDGTTDSLPDTVTVSTENMIPLADAGADQEVDIGDNVMLDGSGSGDSDGDSITYRWSVISKPIDSNLTALSNPDTVNPGFTADKAGSYTIELIVNDGTVDSVASTVTIIAGYVLNLTLADELIGVGQTTTATATLHKPAPAGGITIDILSGDYLIAESDVTTLTFAAGETTQQFVVTGNGAGIVQISGSGNGASLALLDLEVTNLRISLATIATIAPDESTSVVLSINEPAPASGLTITLSTTDPTIATVSPTSVFIPAGSVTPTANAQITGLDFGTTTLRATSPVYAPDEREVVVAIAAAFNPATIAVEMPLSASTVLQLDAPAPAGGLVFDLTVDDPLVTLPSGQITIPAGQIQSAPIALNGLAEGTTVLNANHPDITEASATLSVSAATAYLSRFTTNHVQEAIIGENLQNNYQIRLSALPPEPVDIRISVAADSGVLLSADLTAAGTSSLLFEDRTGLTSPAFYIQGTAIGDDVPLTIEIFEANSTTPIGYDIQPSTVDVDPAGVYLSGSDYTTTTFSAPRAVSIVTAVLRDNEGGTPGHFSTNMSVRGGFDLVVPVNSNSPGIAAPLSSSVTIPGGSASASLSVDPVSAGVASIAINTPPPAPFSIPLNQDGNVQVTVTAPTAYLSRFSSSHIQEAIVGENLQNTYQVRLAATPPADVDIRISVPGGSGVLLSADATTAGTSSLLFEDSASLNSPAFYIQGTAIGDDVPLTIEVFEANSTTPIGYDIQPSTVDVDPAGVYLSGSDYTTTTFSAPRAVNIVTAVLQDNEGGTPGHLSTNMSVRGGFDLVIPVNSNTPGIAALLSSSVTIPGGSASASLSVDPVSAGVASIAITTPPPAPFSIPLNQDGNVQVTVTAPTAYLSRFSSSHIQEAIVGENLQNTYQVRLAATPPADVDIRISVPGGSGVLLSANATTAGTSSLLFEDSTGLNSPAFYIQGTAIGDDVPLTIEIFEANSTTAIGYDIQPSTVDVDPAGVYLSGSDYTTTTFSAPRAVSIVTALLQDNEGGIPGDNEEGTSGYYFSSNMSVRGGFDLVIPVNSNAPGIANPLSSSVTIPGGSSSASLSVDPVSAGVAGIAITTPPPAPFSIPLNRDGNVLVTVVAPDARLTPQFSTSPVSSAIIGDELQQGFALRLEVPPPNPVDVTIEVVDSSVALISEDAALQGTRSVTFNSVTSVNAGTVFIQGIDLNAATQVRVTAAGYNDAIADVNVVASGFRISGPATIQLGQTTNLTIASGRLNANTTWASTQPVRGGASFSFELTASDPAIGSFTTPLILENGDSAENSPFTAETRGTTSISITQPSGFTEPSGQGSIVITAD